jgi:hypothetical protein
MGPAEPATRPIGSGAFVETFSTQPCEAREFSRAYRLARRLLRRSIVTRAWSTLRFTAGMTILTLVFMVSQGLVLVHELTHGDAATERS